MKALLILVLATACSSKESASNAPAAGSGTAVTAPQKPKGPTLRAFGAKPSSGAIAIEATEIADALATNKADFDEKYSGKAVTVSGLTGTLYIEPGHVRMKTPKAMVECTLASGDVDREPLHLIAEAAGKPIQATVTGTVMAGIPDPTHAFLVLIEPCGIVQAMPAY